MYRQMRNELLNKWLKEVNLLLKETEKLPDLITRANRRNMLEKLKWDLLKVRDGLV